MLAMLFAQAPDNSGPLMSHRIPGYLIETRMGIGKDETGQKFWRYQTNVSYLCPWTGEKIGVWANKLTAQAFLEAVNQHHRVVFSLQNRQGSDYQLINRDTVIGTPCKIHEMFGLTPYAYNYQNMYAEEAYEQMVREREAQVRGDREHR